MKRIGELVPPFESCANCSKGGWVTMNQGTKLEYQVRCACWHAHQRRVLDALAAKADRKRK